MKHRRIDLMHRWDVVDSVPCDNPDGENAFLTFEKQLAQINIRSRVVRVGEIYRLEVPLQHAQAARDLYTGAVQTIVTATADEHLLFDSDRRLKNDKLLAPKRSDAHRRMRNRSILFMGLALLITLGAAILASRP